jgi:transcriptional regulator with XRE-family HTH domain
MISICSRPREASRPPNPIDQHVGARVRVRRLMVGMSQTQLAEALEVSSKQVRKYEKGVNHISARLLQHIARVLRVPLAYFFDGGAGAEPSSSEPIQHSNSIAFVMTTDDLRLIRAFALVRNPEVREKLLLLIESLAANPRGRNPRSDEGAA